MFDSATGFLLKGAAKGIEVAQGIWAAKWMSPNRNVDNWTYPFSGFK
jgi:hypothetical protein